MRKIIYPKTYETDKVDDYHGVSVSDPYRWLEDTSSMETREWIRAQNEITFEYLSRIPDRNWILDRLTELWDYSKAWAPLKKGGRYFQFRNTGLQNQDVLFVMDSLDDPGRILLDPNTLSEDGTVALSSWSVSPDGKLLAYAISTSGSDWLNWRVREVDSTVDLPDSIQWSKFSRASWRQDSSGFFYSRYDVPEPGQDFQGSNYYQKLYFHRIGDSENLDTLIYERLDQKEWGFDGQVSDDDRYLVIHVGQGTDTRNRVFILDLRRKKMVQELIPDLEANYEYIGNDGDNFYFKTNLEAPLSRVIGINLNNPSKGDWWEIIPEGVDNLEFIRMVNDEFIALYLKDAHHLIRRYQLDGSYLEDIELPGLGSVPQRGYEIELHGARGDREMFFGFWSFLFPVSIYRYDFATEKSELIYQPVLDIDVNDYITHQVFIPSKDGTNIPMFLTHRRSLSRDGQNPTLLYGYGGFNLAQVPTFDTGRLLWVEMGGVLAWTNLRGGSEYGEEWHQAGMRENKQNVFNDFIACGEYLIAERITSTPRLAIMGRSNGGLLVGAAMTQRPDLFGVAIPIVGVMDMLRFHLFTIGWAWVSDYGCADDPDEFKTLFAYSPLHNLKPGTCYPATLITTGDHDDRVVPGHSFKYAAALQNAQSCDKPTLIRIQTNAGHGVGKPTRLLIEETADILAFMRYAMGE